ncbi:MAG: peptidylprolyl isomerase [Oscillospiraceae bacterium]|nr:peptidylprolyl isomerase [Oscillospiraceae bacterium]
MHCPKCGQELPENVTVCPVCGPEAETDVEETAKLEDAAEANDVTEAAEASGEETSDVAQTEESVGEEGGEAVPEDETAENAEDTEERDREAAEIPDETPPVEAPKKKSKAPVILGIVIALLLVVIVCMGFAMKQMSGGKSISELFQREEPFDADKLALVITDEDGQVVDELTNAELNFHYWGSFYSYINANGISFDLGKTLEDQIYSETEADSTGETTATTWHDYFMENAMLAAIQARGLYLEAQAAGFEMPEDRQAEYDSLMENLATNAQADGFVDEAGNGDVASYIQDSYGEAVTVEMFMDYIYERYYVEAYSESKYNALSFTDEELSDYYDQNADMFTMNYGIEKSDVPDVSVRHILIQPETVEADENGEQDEAAVEAAKEAAKEEAERIYAEWQSGEATEDSFAELATTYSTDPGSASMGGLYEDVYPGQMVTTFNDWCFDESRQPGDTGIVETDFGYHIMYFVGKLDTFTWKQAVDSELRYERHIAYLDELMSHFNGEFQKGAAVQEPPAVRETREQTAAEAAAAATSAVDSAANAG